MKAGASSDDVPSPPPGPGIGPGAVVLVVGPSGAGKDALLAGARTALLADQRFVFVERVISRPAHQAEAHASLGRTEFDAAARSGAFALSWEAHGLGYGIPAGIDDNVKLGRIAVFNASRGIVGQARRRYARVHVLLIDCPVDIRAERLALRGRETTLEARRRLERAVPGFDAASADARIDNSGRLEAGVAALTSLLRSIAAGQSEV